MTSAFIEAYVQQTWRLLGYSNAQNQRLRIAIFGAGAHTRWLESVVKTIEGPVVCAVLDDKPEGSDLFWDLRTIHTNALRPEDVDCLLISSDTVNSFLTKKGTEIFGGKIKVLDLYEGLPQGPYPKKTFYNQSPLEGGTCADSIKLIAPFLRAYVRRSWELLKRNSTGASVTRIAVFGAGAHTAWLQSTTHTVDGPTVVAVLDDSPAGQSHFWGFRPIPPSSWDPTGADAILLSSDTEANQMEEQCRRLYGKSINVVNLYKRLPPGPYPIAPPFPPPAKAKLPVAEKNPSIMNRLFDRISPKMEGLLIPHLPDPSIVHRERDLKGKLRFARYAFGLERRFKNCHYGKEAVLIGNGPSVRIQDLENLRGFVTFACNRFYRCYDRTKFRPTYLVSADRSMVSDFGEEMARECGCPLFLNTADEPGVEGSNVFWIPSTIPHLAPLQFQENIFGGVYCGGGTIITAIQIGYYMGIRRFYLFGVDHSFTYTIVQSNDKFRSAVGDGNHFIPNYRDGKAWCPPSPHHVEQSFIICDAFLRSRGGFLKNATRGGQLEILERIDLDQITRTPKAILPPPPIGKPLMKLLIVSIIPPFPDVQGNRIVLRKLIDHFLGQGAQIDLVLQTQCDPALILRHYKGSVRPVITGCRHYPSSQEREARLTLKTTIQNPALFPGYNKVVAQELTEALNHFHPFEYLTEETVNAVRNLLQQGEYDAIFCNYLYSLRVVHELKSERDLPPSFVVTHDAVSRLDNQAILHGVDTSYRACSKALEISCLNVADHVIAITKNEMDYFREAGVKNLLLSEFPAYEELVAHQTQDTAFDNKIVSIAGSGNPLNSSGLNTFIELAWPTIARQIPGAQLHVFGAVSEKIPINDPAIVRRGILPRKELLKELSSSTISINPVLIGTGLKIKSVEAFCMGIPLVSFPPGIEGMEEFADRACLVSQDWKQFASHCEQLLSDRNMWLQMRNNALKLSRSRFSEQTVYGEIDAALYSICRNPPDFSTSPSGVFSRIPPNGRIIIFGTDETAQQYARRLSRIRLDVSIMGFIGRHPGDTLFGLPVYPIEELDQTFSPESAPLIVIISANSRQSCHALTHHGFNRFIVYPRISEPTDPASETTSTCNPIKQSLEMNASNKENTMTDYSTFPTQAMDPFSNAFKRLLLHVRSAQWSAVALYGAGKHTRRLLTAWNREDTPMPKITCILDDQASGNLDGIPVIDPSECRTYAPQAVIISSDAFEDELYQQAQKSKLDIPVLRMYADDKMSGPTGAIQTLLKTMNALPPDFHTVGALGPNTLSAIAELTSHRPIRCSMETGAGKSTLLLSHLSKRHIVFALNLGGSITAVRSSPLFHAEVVQWVEGPSQVTLPRHQFTEPLDFALIDGPHAYPFPDMEYYYVYPHLALGALLVIDDIHIPTITNLFNFLKEEEMFSLERVVGRTAFFRRTDKQTFPTQHDGWPLQGYNRKHFPVGNDQKMKERLASDTQNEIRWWRAQETGMRTVEELGSRTSVLSPK